MPSAPNVLVRHIELGHGIALYVSAILGAGVLVLPGQVASMAGPASLVSWGLACALGVPLAVMFAALARRYPDAGGVATYVRSAFGSHLGGIAGSWYFVAGSVGQTIVPLTGGYYLTEALGLSAGWSYAIAAGILATATGANLAGVKVSARVQLLLAAAVAAGLLVTIVASMPQMSFARLTPFAPHGLVPVGAAVVVLFFAFAGWEAVAHLMGEFQDPDRDVPRAVAATIAIITFLYLGIAAAVVLTGTYGTPAVDHVAIGRLLQHQFGDRAVLVAAALALVVSLATTNAFIAGVSRLAYSLAREGWLPSPVGSIAKSSVPVGGVLAVGGIAAAGLAIAWILGWGTETLVVVPATLVVAVYLLAAAAGIRLLRGAARGCATAALALTLLVTPTASGHVVIPIAVTIVALIMRALVRRRQAGWLTHPKSRKD